MQIINLVVCDTSKHGKGSLYISKLNQHAFPLMGLVCKTAHATFDGSGGIRSTARPSLGTRLLRGGSNVTVQSHRYKLTAFYKLGSLLSK